jgi:hypothetical protein
MRPMCITKQRFAPRETLCINGTFRPDARGPTSASRGLDTVCIIDA